MLRCGKWFSTILSILLLASVCVVPAQANVPQAVLPQANVGAGVHLLSSTSSGVTFEVNVPWEQLRLEPVTAGGREYVRVSLPGWSETTQAGAPALPMLVGQIGVPFGVSLKLQVVPGKSHTQTVSARIIPVTTQKVKWGLPSGSNRVQALPVPELVTEEDSVVYAGQASYPGGLAQVASDGVLRQQRVVGIVAYPLQYHPGTGQLTVYESLRVEITFEGSTSTLGQAPALESAAYESLLEQDVLNYATARQWRQPAGLPSTLPDSGMNRSAIPWAPPDPGWRIKVQADGFYKLTYSDLNSAGLPVASLDPRTFRLYNLGSQVAIYVEGQSDGIFNQADYILFYGQGISSKYTQDNVYWLTYEGAQGLRMATQSGTPGSAATPAYYTAKRHMWGGGYYISLAPGDENLERWFWDYVFPPSKATWTYSFTLAGPYAGAGTLKVSMLGNLDEAIDPDHHVRISLNGTQLGDFTWDGITWQSPQMTVPQGLLVVGNNTLEVMDPLDTGLEYDVVYIDSAELNFPNTFLAENNELAFKYETTGTWKYPVGGFTTNLVDVYDVSSPAAPIRITGVGVTGSGPYTAEFQDALTAAANYWAGTSAAYRTVQKNEIKIEKDTASNLRSTSNGADHIVIAHPDFLAVAQTLSTFRASQGLRALTVSVQDVYDEFGYGIVGVAPIHAFLAYAYASWQAPAPSFVVLVGDGNYDPKNYYAYPEPRTSYIPPYLAPVDPWTGETAADNRYVTLVGSDTLPDMMLGRLSVNSTAEASAFINKIINYEQSLVSGDWQKQVLAVADNADSAGDFAQYSDDLLSCCLPSTYTAQKVYYGVTHTSVAAARAAIQSGMNAGKLIVNFIGHAYYSGWTGEDLFTTADVPLLTNGGKLPVVLAMTCRDGYYIFPDPYSYNLEALGEVVTRADGRGAVASWSPTGLGVTSGHDTLDRGFFNAVFRDGKATVGEATAAGKLTLFSSGNNLDLLDTFLLFGDPAQRIPRDTYTISGNAGVAGATITFTGGSTTAHGDGIYSFTVSPGWSGTVTPSKTGYTFSPTSHSYTSIQSNQVGQDFIAVWVPPTFSDVPYDYSVTYGGILYPLHDIIQALYDAGYTKGCNTSPLQYCPNNTLTRVEAAVFMLRGLQGTSYAPPTSGYVFADDWTPSTISWGRPWAEGMWDEGLTAGCQASPLLFCPATTFTRAEASVFGLRIDNGAGYTPPAASHIFADDWSSGTVSWAEPWAEQAYLHGLLPACGESGGKPLFCPTDLVTRAWAAYVVVQSKNLPLAP